MISLLFKFFGDSTPLRQEAEKAKKDMGKAGGEIGKEFSNQIKGAIMGTVGVGAVIGTIKKLTQEAVKIQEGAIAAGVDVESYQALAKAAEMVGMTVEKLQEVAPQFAEQFERLISSVENSKGILSADTVNDLTRAAAEMAAFTDPLSKLAAGIASVLGFLRAGGQKVAEISIGSLGVLGGTIGKAFGSKGAKDVQSVGVSLLDDAFSTPISEYRSKPMDESPARAFIGAVKSAEAAASNERLATAVERNVEETRKVREAVERN